MAYIDDTSVEDDLISVFAEVGRIIYGNEDKGFFIFVAKPEKGDDFIATANANKLHTDSFVTLRGKFVDHKTYGKQFKCESLELTTPTRMSDMVRYLSSGAFKGIGETIANKIVRYFGNDTQKVIEETPERLSEVPGVSEKKAKIIVDAIQSEIGVTRMIANLAPLGVSIRKAKAITEFMDVQTAQDAKTAIRRIEDNPYQLTKVRGIGFKTVDAYAMKLGIEKTSSFRIMSGLRYAMDEITLWGHCGAPVRDFIVHSAKLLEVSEQCIIDYIPEAIEYRILIRDRNELDQECYFCPILFSQERSIASNIRTLVERSYSCADKIGSSDLFSLIDRFTAMDRGKVIHISQGQKQALAKVMSSPVSCLVGGPGMGKTTIIRVLLDLMVSQNMQVLMAAPTGKAAKRARETTGRNVVTLHRLLEYNPNSGFGRNQSNPLEADVIVVDEASMIDVYMAYNLLKAVSVGTAIIFVGDVDQLPSVGPGKVLKDMIDSKVVAVGQLTEIFRQGAGSLIIEAAYAVNSGVVPKEIESEDLAIRFIDPTKNIGMEVLEAVKECSGKYNFSPDDIQILSPIKKGEAGTEELNKLGQSKLNLSPSFENVRRGEITYRVGDRIMQTRNDYSKAVFNGEIGKIASIDLKNDKIMVDYIDRELCEYSYSEMEDLMMAFASTVHRYQGSEAPCVIMVLTGAHYMMLKRNMLYTAITRAAKRLVILTERKALERAVMTLDGKIRVSKLKGFLTGDHVFS